MRNGGKILYIYILYASIFIIIIIIIIKLTSLNFDWLNFSKLWSNANFAEGISY